MRSKLLAGEMLSQCPTCNAVEVLTDEKSKRTNYQQSICDLPSLTKKICWSCKSKQGDHSGDVDEMVVEKGVDIVL
jgi:hypothetical protein